MSKRQKQVNLDAEIGELLAAHSAHRGVRQQHALSAAVFFYLATGDQVRAVINDVYSRWAKGEEFGFVTEEWVTEDTSIPYLMGKDADSFLLMMSMIAGRTNSSQRFAMEAREFLEGGKKPAWLIELDPNRDHIEQLKEKGIISEKRIEKGDTKNSAKAKPKRKKQ